VCRFIRQLGLRKKFLYGFITLCGCFLLACDQDPRVTINGGAVPSCQLSGQGVIQAITVGGPDFANPNSREAGSRYMKPYWEIAPTRECDIQTLKKSGPLVYGRLPDGFRQVVPENGSPPLPLPEDELLGFGLRTADGPALGVRFVIHSGKVVVEGS